MLLGFFIIGCLDFVVLGVLVMFLLVIFVVGLMFLGMDVDVLVLEVVDVVGFGIRQWLWFDLDFGVIYCENWKSFVIILRKIFGFWSVVGVIVCMNVVKFSCCCDVL